MSLKEHVDTNLAGLPYDESFEGGSLGRDNTNET